MKNIQSIRGMNDMLPQDTGSWQYLESVIRQLLSSYSYREIRFPIVEQTALFQRSIGEVTDIVEKEMYTFKDRNDESITLRPEGTASCVRACIQHGLLDNQQHQRLWYAGPMFRYEKPQKGRLRQFHQIGVEAFGMASAAIDAEMIALTARLWKRLGVDQAVTLELNSLGSTEARAEYRQVLVDYLQQHIADLDSDSQRRLQTNPMRILDSKSEQTQAVLANAPVLADYLDQDSRQHFAQLRQMLDNNGIAYRVNPRLVRGLDYYSRTVFEWVTDKLGAQGTVCAGGRYDGLVEQLGGKPCPAVGFAMGIERLLLLLQACSVERSQANGSPEVFVVVAGDQALPYAQQMTEMLHQHSPDLRIQMHCEGGSFKSQFKRADKSGAAIALVVGESELAERTVVLKPLRLNAEQRTVALDEIAVTLEQSLQDYYTSIKN